MSSVRRSLRYAETLQAYPPPPSLDAHFEPIFGDQSRIKAIEQIKMVAGPGLNLRVDPHTPGVCVIRFMQEEASANQQGSWVHHGSHPTCRTRPTLSYAESGSRQQCDEIAADH